MNPLSLPESENVKRGIFIAIDSVDPYDSNLFANLVYQWMLSLDMRVMYLNDPHGDIEQSADIYRIVTANTDIYTTDILCGFEFLLRKVYLKSIVEPAIKSGSWAVLNGFTSSSYGYAMSHGGVTYRTMTSMENLVMPDVIYPDMVFIIDTPFGVSYKRARESTSDILSSYEKNIRTYYNKKRTEMLIRATAQSSSYTVIDNEDNEENTLLQIKDFIIAHKDFPFKQNPTLDGKIF